MCYEKICYQHLVKEKDYRESKSITVLANKSSPQSPLWLLMIRAVVFETLTHHIHQHA